MAADGITVELLMLSSAAAIVGGLFVATESEGSEAGWIVVSMKDDWKRIFALEQSPPQGREKP